MRLGYTRRDELEFGRTMGATLHESRRRVGLGGGAELGRGSTSTGSTSTGMWS